MRKFIAIVLVIMTGCASIVSKSSYPVNISSVPHGAKIKIVDRKGTEVYNGTTPAMVSLKSGNGFFKKGIYTINFSKEGYKDSFFTLEADLDGWYFGNIIFGGVIGLLIVDPATGAMYKLNNSVIHALPEENVASSSTKALNVYSIDDLPSEYKPYLEKIN